MKLVVNVASLADVAQAREDATAALEEGDELEVVVTSRQKIGGYQAPRPAGGVPAHQKG
jgi:hypothetical protein